MKTIELEIKNKLGIHARPASLIAKTAMKFDSEIHIKTLNAQERINAKSIMGIMLLAAAKGVKIIIEADGQDEDEAIFELVELIVENKFFEE